MTNQENPARFQEEARSSPSGEGNTPKETDLQKASNDTPAQVPPQIPSAHEPLRNTADMQAKIQQRAHELWVAGGCREGQAEQDWALAEEEILGITGGG